MSEPGSLIRSLSGRSAARNFHSFVINEIGVGIASGRFPVGSILPRDAELMDMYGVSRTVLREALKTLEAKGLVEARPKVGTRVSPKSRWALFDQQVLLWHFEAGPEESFIRSLFDIRRLLEIEAVSLAAKHRTADHIRLMHYWVQQMEISRPVPESFAIAALELHRVTADASHNPLMRSITGIVEFALATTMPGGAGGEGEYDEATVAAYRGLVHLIERADAEHAAAAMSDIIAAELQSAITNMQALD
jgi:DNA-binding FadR family transcriptional regulator